MVFGCLPPIATRSFSIPRLKKYVPSGRRFSFLGARAYLSQSVTAESNGHVVSQDHCLISFKNGCWRQPMHFLLTGDPLKTKKIRKKVAQCRKKLKPYSLVLFCILR